MFSISTEVRGKKLRRCREEEDEEKRNAKKSEMKYSKYCVRFKSEQRV